MGLAIEAAVKPQIDGYSVGECLSESTKTRVYACVRLEDKKPLVLKVLNYSHPSPSAIARFKYEYEIAKKFSSQFVVTAYDMVEIGHSFGFFMEYGPPSIADQLNGPLGLEEFFELAIGCVEALDYVHQQQIVHKDINPSNILWDSEKKVAKIIDFGISSLLSHEKIENKNTQSLEGSLPYLSPEQTGRLNRDLDYRSDYYSLGISFYKVLTGNTPFNANGVLKWIHNHITKTPTHPAEIRSDIPGVLSQIILKLIEKDASARYQSKATLLSDIKRCQHQWLKEGKIDLFEIAQNDISQKFYVPTNLYGRTEEKKVLDRNLNNVIEGKKRIVAVVGYSGVGKTTLIRELQGSILNRGGYFVEGKYEHFKRNIPFYGFVQAVDNIVKLILSDSDDKISKIRSKLNSELKSSFPILIDLIPNLKELLALDIDAVDQEQIDKNRFYLVFNKLISIIAASDCPLVIFLDDLQWADSATLNMLAEWYSGSNHLKKVLMVCSYRENEVKAGSNLQVFLDSLETSKCFDKLNVGPLALPNVKSVVAKTLGKSSGEVDAISNIIYEKTKGNPFFIKKMLYYFYEQNYIWFDQKDGSWTWDLKKLENAEVSHNVVDFLINNMQSLNNNTRRMLTLAASIGDNFDFSVLFKIIDFPKKEIFDCLWEAMVHKLIFPLDAEYKYIKLNSIFNAESIKKVKFKFQHDKVQEAAYALLNADLKMKVHLDIGRILYKNYKKVLTKDNLGEITKHYNLAIDLIDSNFEKSLLLELNTKAGINALNSSAVEIAFRHFKIAMQFVDISLWKDDYELCYSLYVNYSVCCYLTDKFELAEKASHQILLYSNDFDKASYLKIQMVHFMMHNLNERSINSGISALNKLGVNVSLKIGWLRALWEAFKVEIAMAGKKPRNILGLRQCKSKEINLISEVLNEIIVPIYLIGNKKMTIYVIAKSISLILKNGLTATSPNAFVIYATLVTSIFRRYRRGLDIGKVAIKLLEKDIYNKCAGKTNFYFYSLILIWHKPLRDIVSKMRKAAKIAYDYGDYQFYSYLVQNITYWQCDLNLEESYENEEKILEGILEHNYPELWWNINIAQNYRKNLMGKNGEGVSLSDEHFSEDQFLERQKSLANENGVAHLHFFKIQLYFHYGFYTEALESATELRKRFDAINGLFYVKDTFLFSFLSYCEACKVSDRIERIILRRNMRFYFRLVNTWAKFSREYHMIKLLMIAELYALKGKKIQARLHYNKAIKAAKNHKNLHYQALFNERAALLFMDQSPDFAIASEYMSESYYCYEKWGAISKVKYIRNIYSKYLLGRESIDKIRSSSAPVDLRTMTQNSMTTSTTTTTAVFNVDMETILKSSNAISQEVVLSKVIEKIMVIAKENAGAERGILMLVNDEEKQLVVQAEIASNNVNIMQNKPFEEFVEICRPAVNYVYRSKQSLIINDVSQDLVYGKDEYVQLKLIKSILCMPILHQGELMCILYLENSVLAGVFTQDRITILEMLSAQAAVSIKNANLYENLEQKVKDRTREIEEKNKELTSAVEENKNLVRILCHDLNNTLSIIKSSGLIALNKFQKLTAEKHMRLWNKVIKASQTQEEIIQHVRNMEAITSGKQKVELQAICFNDIVEKGRFIFNEKLAEKDLTLSFTSEIPGDIYVLADQVTLSNNVFNRVV